MVKIIEFFAGVMFFGLFPIASNYPQYRLLASPMKWLFWKVPTDGKRGFVFHDIHIFNHVLISG